MKRGEVWLINLDPTIGAEIKKTRPAIIVSSDAVGVLPLKVVVPLTDWKDRYEIASWMIKVEPGPQNGLEKISAVDTFQIRSVAQERFVRKLGKVDAHLMLKIADGIIQVLEIGE